MSEKKRLIIGITGATGAIYGVRILQVLRAQDDWESHLIISDAGALNLKYELELKRNDVYQLADEVHNIDEIGATIASGAYPTEGMVIAPCSMKTLSNVAHANSDNLIARAADVTLKERRRLIVVPRETPLNLAHIRNMAAVTEMGGIIFPPLPAFYARKPSLDQLVDETVGRILGFFGAAPPGLYEPWQGLSVEKPDE